MDTPDNKQDGQQPDSPKPEEVAEKIIRKSGYGSVIDLMNDCFPNQKRENVINIFDVLRRF